MILVFDVGNTETTLALFEGEAMPAHWRIVTDASRTPDELALLLRGLLGAREVVPSRVQGVAIGSVVPGMNDALSEACQGLFGTRPLMIDARSELPIRLDVIEPLTVGADRIINTLAASRLFESDTIVVDLGTATTYDCITKEGVFLGGVIAPGIRTSAETLFRRTSKLPATELLPPATVIGRRTEDCIRSGVVFGAAEALDGMVRRIKAEWPTPRRPLVVTTGGLAAMISPICQSVDRVEPHLTLVGLRMAYGLLAGGR
ncbi:MAG: type III pantothenate kinase [Gemmatimonadaceae bacterium]